MDIKFFDLHSHPVVKTLFKEQNNAISAWLPFVHNIRLVSGLDSQCSLDQISESGMNLVCFTRHAVERGMLDQRLLRIASRFYYQLDRSRLIKLAHGVVSYTQQLADEWINLHKTPDGKFPNKKLQHLKKLSDYDETDQNTLYLIYNVEGGHIFNELGKICEDLDRQSIICKLEDLEKECPMIFYITPTHLTPNNLITHAYGNKILDYKPFLPNSFGICKTGETLINEIYKKNILVDIKHMSLISRKQFYDFHSNNYKDSPIIASHMAFTGLSWENLRDTVTPIRKGLDFVKIEQPASEGIVQMKSLEPISGIFNSSSTKFNSRQTKFNPSSINLYEEEIEIILNSSGLIGILFDVRLLGAEIKETVTEFLSKKEYEKWQELFDVPKHNFLRGNNIYSETNNEVLYTEEDVNEYLEELQLDFPDESDYDYELKISDYYFRVKEEEHLLHFINHLLYIVVLCNKRKIKINPWKHICIGSDFDGLIASMYCCRDATYLPSFAQKLEERIPEEAQKAGITMPTPIDKFIPDLFFNNAYRIMETHFKKEVN